MEHLSNFCDNSNIMVGFYILLAVMIVTSFLFMRFLINQEDNDVCGKKIKKIGKRNKTIKIICNYKYFL